MREQYETFINNLMNSIENLVDETNQPLFKEVEFGGKPASVDRLPGCYIIPQPIRCVNVTPNVVEWRFPVVIQVTSLGSYVSKDTFMSTLGLVDRIIKMIESDITIGGSVDHVEIDVIEPVVYAERVDFMIQIVGVTQVQEV